MQSPLLIFGELWALRLDSSRRPREEVDSGGACVDPTRIGTTGNSQNMNDFRQYTTSKYLTIFLESAVLAPVTVLRAHNRVPRPLQSSPLAFFPFDLFFFVAFFFFAFFFFSFFLPSPPQSPVDSS